MHVLKLLPLAVFTSLALIPTAHAAKNGALDRRFAKLDIDSSQFLEFSEFYAIVGRNKPWVDAKYRFDLADHDRDGLISLIEFRASNGGKAGGRPSKAQRFIIADLDRDNHLDPIEFALTQAQSKPSRKLMRDFGRKDKNNDMKLTYKEFGGGGSLPL